MKEQPPQSTFGQLKQGCELLHLSINEEQLKQLACYATELLHWSKKINLIAKKQSLPQVIENHFLDSLMLLSFIKSDLTLVDVGSGAGFPGLVCKAALPDLKLTLIEPRLKRVSFLRHIIRTLQLDDVTVLPRRVEEIPPASLICSTITSRAVAEIEDFLQMVQGFANNHTRIICMKGPKWKNELRRASSFLKTSKLELIQVYEFNLPFSGAYRAILCFAIP